MPIRESQLIRKIKAGDKDAFKHLVSLYKNRAFGLCYSIVGNTEDAKDILQESFIKAYKNIRGFREDASFYTWFYRILVNTSRDYLRKKAHNRATTLENADNIGISLENPAVNKELKMALYSAISELSGNQRISFVMKHINGMNTNEIAEILECRPATVKIHLFRAAKKLQKKLGPYLAADA